MGNELPADVPTFLAEVEARSAYADPNDSDVRRFYNAKSCADVPVLLAIVREQNAIMGQAIDAALLATSHLEACAAENAELRKAYRLASETTADTVKENCALREQMAELATLRKDLEDAAGELMVPVPEPGSVASKMLLANRIMFRERDALRERLAKMETAVRATGESLEGCTLSHPDGITVALIRLEELRECVESEEP